MAPLAVRPPVATYVAVGEPADEDAAEAASRRNAERRAIARRLRDAGLRAAVRSMPGLAWPLLAAVAAMLGTAGVAPVQGAWAAVTSLLAGAWAFLARALRAPPLGPLPVGVTRRRPLLADTRARRRVLVAAAVVVLGDAALAPWLPLGPFRYPDPWLVASSLAVPALAAGFVLAPLGRPGALAMLPVLSAAAAGLHAGPPMPDVRLLHLAILLLPCVATATLVRWRWRGWSAARRRRFEHEDDVRLLEAQRDAAQRADQEKTRFLAVACHDLRQPMHALGLFAATLERRLEGSADQPIVRNLMRSINGLERSFNAMLDISRLDAGSVEPSFQYFPLRDLFRRLHMHYIGQAEQRGLGLRFSPGGKSVYSDPQLLERIVGNLVQNAIRYTEHGGIVVVARTTVSHLHIEVWDTGSGIAADDLPRVFEEFSQVGRGRSARGQGLGMGLAIVRRLARLLGHRLDVASRPGRGTMFRVGIPIGGLADIQAETAAADTRPMEMVLPQSVLVIDDEKPIRDGLQMLLEEWGYQVACAGSLEEAQRVIDRAGAPPDVVVSDLHLGDGPDGLAVVDALRRHCGQALPALLVTGDTSHEWMRRATASGLPVLFKPVQPRRLFDALRGFAPATPR